MLSFIVPAYNEQEHISKTISNIIKAVEGKIPFEVIAINDGSTDDTAKEINRFKEKSNSRISIINNNINKGNAESVHLGVISSKYNHVFLVPGDNTYDYIEISKIVDVFVLRKVVLNTKVDCIIGIRKYDKRNITRKFFAQMSRILVFILSPTRSMTPNVGLILTNVKFCFPINEKFPKNYYHLGLLVNWRIQGAEVVSAGNVYQTNDSGSRTQSIGIFKTIRDLRLFVNFLNKSLK
jgi:glycosyltransferase involved in cell wall biosynthesis